MHEVAHHLGEPLAIAGHLWQVRRELGAQAQLLLHGELPAEQEDERIDPLSLQVVADALGYSPAYLTNLIRKLTGKTIQQWIRDVRMRHARDLMIRTEAPIKEIAMMVGYSDPNYFVRHFRKLYDVPPTTWRQRNAARPT